MGSDLLQIGKSGLMASKKSLETTGHNIANANTEGYSRKRIVQETNIPIGEGNLVHGTGVRINSIQRFSDEFVEKTVSRSSSNHSYFEERANLLGQVEEIFNEVNSDGLSKVMSKFFNGFRELANQPENEVVRSVVRDNAKIVVTDFHRISEHLQGVVNSMDRKLDKMTEDINLILKNISELNSQITELENTNGEAGDLRDQRDLAIKDLSKFFEVNTYLNERGNYVVSAEGVGTVVSGRSYEPLLAGNSKTPGADSDHYGSKEIYLLNRPSSPVSSHFQKGALAAVVDTRNQEVKKLQDQIDQVAFELANTVNAIHRKGFANVEIAEDEQGNVRIPAGNKVTEIDFFKAPTQTFGAASSLDISSAIKEDLRNIATALEPNHPGDNIVALAISKLQHEKILLENTTTLEEFYLKSLGLVGVATSKAKLDEEQSKGILAQHEGIRERVSGVSIDEETSNMVKTQQAYDASARVIRTADDMFKSLLEMWRP